MQSPPALPEDLIRDALTGDGDAAREVVERYTRDLRIVIRCRLRHGTLRRSHDTNDFVQAVWATFFTGAGSEDIYHDEKAFVAYLRQIARNKVVSEWRKARAKKRLPEDHNPPADEEEVAPDEVVGPTPTASQDFLAVERWDEILRHLPEVKRQALAMLQKGHSRREVAVATGLTQTTVSRLVKRLRGTY